MSTSLICFVQLIKRTAKVIAQNFLFNITKTKYCVEEWRLDCKIRMV